MLGNHSTQMAFQERIADKILYDLNSEAHNGRYQSASDTSTVDSLEETRPLLFADYKARFASPDDKLNATVGAPRWVVGKLR